MEPKPLRSVTPHVSCSSLPNFFSPSATRLETNTGNFPITPLNSYRRSNVNTSIYKTVRTKNFVREAKHDIFDKKVHNFIAEGEGTENISSVRKIAEEKVVTTSNIDRWKRSFQSMKHMLRKEGIGSTKEEEENIEDEINLFYERSRKGTVLTNQEQALEMEDVYEELTSTKTEKSPGIINPDSIFKAIWDCLSLLLTIYQAIVVPFKLAFDCESGMGLAYFEVIVDFFFIIDISIFIIRGLNE